MNIRKIEELAFSILDAELKQLLDERGPIDDAIALIEKGANPNTKDSTGIPLLHLIVGGINSNIMGTDKNQLETLVQKYNANIEIKDADGLTPLQYLISARGGCSSRLAIRLVLLGADYSRKNTKNLTLLEILEKQNKQNKLNTHIEIIKTRQREARQNFLTLIYYLANEYANQQSNSFFCILPLELIIRIFSFLDFGRMGKTPVEALALIMDVFSNAHMIKVMAGAPGGIHVFQSKDSPPKFKFFKAPIKTVSHKLKRENEHQENNKKLKKQ